MIQSNTKTQTKDNQSIIGRLFAAGAHFGFTKSRRHPTVLPYIFATKQGTDIIDLEKTARLIETAREAVKGCGQNGKTVLFVGTKEEISKIVKSAAESIDMPYVINRWIGGMLTNFPEIKKRIARLHTLREQGETGELERKYTKKERVVIGRELEKLSFNFEGVKSLDRAPGLVVIVDPRYDSIALKEATFLKIPVIGIGSSDTNLVNVTYPIVVNDALQASVTLILSELTEAFKEGKAQFKPASRRDETRRPTRS